MALIVALLFVRTLFPINVSEIAKTQGPLADNRQEAERLWELAIAAKGGRERLHSVNNLQISIREKVWYQLRRVPLIAEELYVFPDKSWEWEDQSKTIFGFSLKTYNRAQKIDFWYTDHGKGGNLGIVSDYVHGDGGLIHLYDVQLRYLMETKWVKPIPVSVQKEKRDGKWVDVVQTIIKGYPTRDGTNEERLAFALDQETHLPVMLIYTTVTFGKEYTGEVPLTDYVEVAGIQVPSKVYDLRTTYQINVDYDDNVFIREPNVAAGIKQWEKKQ